MRNFILLLLIFSLNSLVKSQDTIYYSEKGDTILSKVGCSYYKVTSTIVDSIYTVQKYNVDDVLKSENRFLKIDQKKGMLQGKQQYWYSNGKFHYSQEFQKEKSHGNLNVFWENGAVKRKEVYENGNFVSSECFDSLGNKIEFYEFSVMPKFTADKSIAHYINSVFNTPSEILELGISGETQVKFVVDKQGKVTNVEVIKSIHPSIDKEAIRVVLSMPDWIPGSFDGKNVSIYYVVPIRIIVEEPKQNKKKKR